MPRSRYEACSLLQAHNIDCAIWFEDAIAHYGVPTVVFDLYLLVPDIEQAAESLQQHGWHDAPRLERDTFHFLQDSPTLRGPLHYLRLVPPDWDDNTEQRTVLMPADAWDFTAHQLAQAVANSAKYYPPLPALLDSLIDAYLDAPRGSNLQGHIAVQCAYVYEYVAQVKQASFGDQLRPEHRQFHRDCLGEGALWTLPFRDHQLQVRDNFLKGQNTLASSIPHG